MWPFLVHPSMSPVACSPCFPLGLSFNNEIAFHSDGAAEGLKAQRVIKGLVFLISSDPLWMAAVTLYQHGDLQVCRCILIAGTVAAGTEEPCHMRESHWIWWPWLTAIMSLVERTSTIKIHFLTNYYINIGCAATNFKENYNYHLQGAANNRIN